MRALIHAARLAIPGHDLVLDHLIQVVADELRELLAFVESHGEEKGRERNGAALDHVDYPKGNPLR
jgi:hypothetical protein